MIASAKARGVPVVSAKQMLDWLDARNASSFTNITWGTGQLTFTVAPGTGARNLDMLVPARSGTDVLSSVTRNGAAVDYDTRSIKGADYAFVPATAGNYVATYARDTTAPTVTNVSPADGATGTASNHAVVTATFSEALDPATVTAGTFELRGPADTLCLIDGDLRSVGLHRPAHTERVPGTRHAVSGDDQGRERRTRPSATQPGTRWPRARPGRSRPQLVRRARAASGPPPRRPMAMTVQDPKRGRAGGEVPR